MPKKSFHGVDAGWQQVDCATTCSPLVQYASGVVCDLLNAPAAAQVGVLRVAHMLLIESEGDMDTRRLDIGIDHCDALTPPKQAAGQ